VFDDPSTNEGVADGLDGSVDGQLFGQVTAGDLTLTGAYGRRRRDVPTAAFGANFNDPRFSTVDERGFVDVQFPARGGRRLRH
jgi:iron complex outermembrane receptor protein